MLIDVTDLLALSSKPCREDDEVPKFENPIIKKFMEELIKRDIWIIDDAIIDVHVDIVSSILKEQKIK